MQHLPDNDEEKCQIVLNNNTYYFNNPEYEEESEANILQLSQLLTSLKRSVEAHGLKKDLFVDFIQQRDHALRALLALTGFSRESLLRLVTFVRVVQDSKLTDALNRTEWASEPFDREWTEKYIIKLSQTNKSFAKCLVTLFFDGATYDVLKKALPLFDLKKLSASKLDPNFNDLIDTIVRYNVRGAYKARNPNNPEILLQAHLEKHGYEFERGKLENISRKMDFIIPNKDRPKVIVESSFVTTTSSAMGDKAKAEIGVAREIQSYYEYAIFVGFVDGIGWLARQKDLKRLLSAFKDVYTYAPNELDRFIEFLNDVFGR